MRTGMKVIIAAGLLTAPAMASAADPDAVCAMGLIDTAAYAKERPGLSAEFRAGLNDGAEFFSGVVIGRYRETELSDVLAAAAMEVIAEQKRQELVMRCFGRHSQARDRLRAANQRAREKVLGPAKNPSKPR